MEAQRSSWVDAEEHCVTLGGHLWSVNSHEEWTNLLRTNNNLEMSAKHEGRTLNDQKWFDPFLSRITFIGLTNEKVYMTCTIDNFN